MVAGFNTRRRFPFKKRDAEKEKIFWEQHTGVALLQSSVNDADLLTDWAYFYQILRIAGHDIPHGLRTLQLVSCVCGTVAWVIIASDGRVMDWIRRAAMWIVVVFLEIIRLIFFLMPLKIAFILRTKNVCERRVIRGIESRLEDCEWWFEGKIIRTRSFFETGFPFSGGAILFLGILMEDIPQIVVTFLIEDVITSDEAKGVLFSVSGTAQLNLILAAFDIAHKLAEAYDLRNELFKAGDAALVTLRGHADTVESFVVMDGSRFVSGSKDKKVKLWDASTGKLIRSFEDHAASKYADVADVAKLDEARIVSASSDNTSKVFDVESGTCLKSIRHGGGVLGVAVSPNGESFLTGDTWGMIRLWRSSDFDLIEKFDEIITKYVHSIGLTFLDDHAFVAADEESSTIHVKILSTMGSPSRKYDAGSNVKSVAVMSPGTSFLTGLSNGITKLWSDNGITKLWSVESIGDSSDECSKTFEGHRGSVDSLAKIDDSRFVSGSSDKTAKIWDVRTGSCLHTFTGHTDSVGAVAYIPDERKLLTGSGDNSIKIWEVDEAIISGEGDESEEWGDKHDNRVAVPTSVIPV